MKRFIHGLLIDDRGCRNFHCLNEMQREIFQQRLFVYLWHVHDVYRIQTENSLISIIVTWTRLVYCDYEG